ncbi:hypothetical protein SAMN04487995_0938 [Dyadobacter koreensis]|uniref:Uncharacterized protein n=1 Tax=Dyadobacter koreensis TaxID=408657 RepID=A0A1H6QR96_9BACT|nr:hypothetical protein [Dyadobacter koreensis]SEI46338.1 hypothetical protein SAMN04487995_0938 [Dyadobacter koreensis]
MKAFLFFFVVTIFPFVSNAQKPPKNAKQIILTVDSTKSQETTVKEFVSYLNDRSYEIDNYNKDLGLVTTKGKEVKFWQLRLSVFIENNKIKITGTAFTSMLGIESYWPVENKGSLGSVFVHTWRETNETALNFPHSMIEYR